MKPYDIETGEGASKLKNLRENAGRARRQFLQVASRLPRACHQQPLHYATTREVPDLTTFHYVSDIPRRPKPSSRIPIRYFKPAALVGRQPELNLLTDWVAKPDSEVYNARILNVVAIGGLGKSALTWKWFNDIAPQEMQPLAGRMWWSFYETDATFENFVTRALAYVTRRPTRRSAEDSRA